MPMELRKQDKICKKKKREEVEKKKKKKRNHFEKLVSRNHYTFHEYMGLRFLEGFDSAALSISGNYPKRSYEEKLRKRGPHSEYAQTRGRHGECDRYFESIAGLDRGNYRATSFAILSY